MSTDLEDYWAILALEPGASKQDVQRAYRKKTLAVHPDRYKGSDPEWANAEFLRLTRAKEVLEDDKARAAFEALQLARAKHREKQEAQGAGRKKLREDLEAREEAARKRMRAAPSTSEQAQAAASASAEAQQEAAARAELHRELERLRRTGRLGGGASAAASASTGSGVPDGATVGEEGPALAGGVPTPASTSRRSVSITLSWGADKSFQADALRQLLQSLGMPEEGLVLAMVGSKAVVELPSASLAKALAERSVEMASRGIRMTVQQPPAEPLAGKVHGSQQASGADARQDALAAGWKAQRTAGRKVYYYHVATRRTQWTMPTDANASANGAGAASEQHERYETYTLTRLQRASERQRRARQLQAEPAHSAGGLGFPPGG